MIEWRYGKLLSITMQHGYYTDERCPDWRLSPSAATRQLIAQHQLLWKDAAATGQGTLLGELKGADFQQPLDAAARLVFYMQLTRPAFMQYTDPAMVPGQQVLLWTNAGGVSQEQSLVLRKVWLKRPSISHRVPATLANGTQLRLLSGSLEVQNLTVQGGLVQCELGSGAMGLYRLVYPDLSEEWLYVDAEALRLGVQGLIVLDHALPGGLTGRSYTLRFAARSALWTYFVALSPLRDGLRCQVVDKSGAGAEFAEIGLDAQGVQLSLGPEGDAFRAAIQAHYRDAKVFVQQSTQPLPWKEGPRPGLVLEKTLQGETKTVMKGLASPTDSSFVILRYQAMDLLTVTA